MCAQKWLDKYYIEGTCPCGQFEEIHRIIISIAASRRGTDDSAGGPAQKQQQTANRTKQNPKAHAMLLIASVTFGY
jgi:hypothetical protein